MSKGAKVSVNPCWYKGLLLEQSKLEVLFCTPCMIELLLRCYEANLKALESATCKGLDKNSVQLRVFQVLNQWKLVFA